MSVRRISTWLAAAATVLAAAAITLAVLNGAFFTGSNRTASGPAIDTLLDPVSLSNPTADAAEALKLCQVDRLGPENVAGMGHVPADKLVDYAPFAGVEPELTGDELVWAVVFDGKSTFGRTGTTVVNAVCVVSNGDPTIYAPSGHWDRGGVWHAGVSRDSPPPLALPTLAP